MPVLESDLRRQLETVIIRARDVAEAAARSALQKRAVDVAEPFSHFGPKEKELRSRLRARGRQAGDVRNGDKSQSIDQLTQELAYEFWHRMLFARFLAENHLLMHPDGVAVSLEECEELAKDADPPAPNGFVLAARYASRMLPRIFRTDDVLLEIEFAPEQRLKLEKLLASLPRKTFVADDSLGWVYQFWQAKKKEAVNKSGAKIDGRTLSAVTQLFTEHYMVEFLLHNTIGAWWCGRNGIQGPPGGAGVPAGQSPVKLDYLRCRDDGTPAAGKFEGWPMTLAEFTMLDPCCGSGHFLVAAFNLLVPLRMHDEKLTAEKACEAVLRDNLFGLELDPRGDSLLLFEKGEGRLRELASLQDRDRGRDHHGVNAWGKQGVAVNCMGRFASTLYNGSKFDANIAAIIPKDPELLPAIWCFCKSAEFSDSVRRIDQSLKVTNATLVKVPFDIERWQQAAAEEYPNGLPESHSDDPTQWLFKGHPKGSTDPLQVAVARLLGYRWPDQQPGGLDTLADADGIVPIPAVRSDDPAAGRLREVLRIAFGSEWSASMEDRLLVESGAKSGTSLDDWLRNQFFEQHCKRFHNRPFLWHIWDGRRDGFSVLANYHKLDHKAMENLTYSYLGDWIIAQSRSESVGADLRLAAAQTLQEKLKRILAGEPPYDIFVRWKPLHKQAIGWQPDLNDGVRMNIRPFVRAGILRKPPNIKWTKDRGKEPERPKDEYPWFWTGDVFTGDRVNDVHITNAQKQAARKMRSCS